VVWDRYFAIGEKKQGARVLINASEVANTNAFFIANCNFANQQSAALRRLITGLSEAATWAEEHRDDLARTLRSDK
jgi:sulfonate transport system substrate-binding protein